MKEPIGHLSSQNAVNGGFAWLKSRIHPLHFIWVLLVVVIPRSGGQARAAPFITRLLTWPGMIEAALVLATGLGVMWMARRAPGQLLEQLRSPWILPLAAYYGLGLLASGFSQHGLFALAYGAEALVGLLLTVLVFGGRFNASGRSSLQPLYFVAALYCAEAAMAWMVDPGSAWMVDIRGSARLSGLVLHPNQLGFLAALLGVGGVSLMLDATAAHRRVLALGMLGLALPILIASRSRTDLLSFFAGVFVMVMLRGKWRLIVGATLSILAAIAFMPRLAIQAFAFLNRGLQAPVVAGRVAIWEYIIQRSLSTWSDLLLGEGIGTTPRVLIGVVQIWPYPGHAHNLLIEALNNVGIPGVVLVLVSLGTVAYGVVLLIRRKADRAPEGASQLLAIFLLVLAASVVEHSFAGRANIYSFAYWVLAATCTAHLGPGLRPADDASPTNEL